MSRINHHGNGFPKGLYEETMVVARHRDQRETKELAGLIRGWTHTYSTEDIMEYEIQDGVGYSDKTTHALYPEKIMPSAFERQEGGDHYLNMAIQPSEYIHKNGIGYMEGTAIVYLSRHKAKNGVEDLRKAIHTIEQLIEMEEGKT